MISQQNTGDGFLAYAHVTAGNERFLFLAGFMS